MYKKTRSLLFILSSIFCFNGYAQFYSESNTNEAKEMAAIINSFTFLELYNSDAKIIPKGYEKIVTSEVLGMDNKYQIYKTKTNAVINLRGSTTKKISWMENIYSSMVPAKGKIILEEETFHYNFSKVKNAGVHAGYALAIAFLSKDIISNINALNADGIYNITITGHSQGGALAILLRAYLEHLPKGEISKKNRFKTYAFANPKVGNAAFINDYLNYCKEGTNYSIVNVKDLVPKMPFSPDNHDKMSTKESLSKLLFDKSANTKDVAISRLNKLFGGSINSVMRYTSESALKQIRKKVGKVVMPNIKDVNYGLMGNRIELAEFEYPKILKDPTILQNDSLMTYYQKDEEGVFINKSLYKKEPSIFQHKTYNYYTFFMKKYYFKEYDELELKFLPENL